MKKLTLSLITTLIVVLGVSNSTYAAKLNNQVVTVLSDIAAINKIEVHGNVLLYVSDGSADQVKVYNQYYGESALVQSKNGVLRISSYKAEKLVIWVTANDLRSISAYDNAEVDSFGNLTKIEFNVDLHNNSTAKLNLNTYSANVTVNDNAIADLTGKANEFNLNNYTSSKVSNANFTAVDYTERKLITLDVLKDNDVMGL